MKLRSPRASTSYAPAEPSDHGNGRPVWLDIPIPARILAHEGRAEPDVCARMSKAQTIMTITAQPTRLVALLAAFDQRTSAFDRALDQLAIAFQTIEAAILAARTAGLPLPQLASALSLGAQQLAAARSMLVLTADESSIAGYADAERGLLDELDRALREPGTDAKAIGRLQEDFLEHEPADRIALAAGLHGTFLIRQAFLAVARATPAPAAKLIEASFALTLARNHLGGPNAAFGPRYADYLARYTQLADELTAAL